ncbi:TraB/VirB10 family protein [Sulfurimonas sp.]
MYEDSHKDKKDFLSNIVKNWKKRDKNPKEPKENKENEEFDALSELSTLDQKSHDLRQKTIKRFVYVMLSLSLGMFILVGLVKFTMIMYKGQPRKVLAPKVQDVKLEINTFSKWQELKDQEIVTLHKDIKSVDANLSKKISDVKNELKSDINSTTVTILNKIDKNQENNNKFLNTMLDNLKKEISKSEKKVKKYADSKNLTIEEKIKKIKSEALSSLQRTKNKIDFSKLSLPTLPKYNGKKGTNHNQYKSRKTDTNSYPSKTKQEITEIAEEAIVSPVSINISTLNMDDNKTDVSKKDLIFTIMPGFTKGTIVTGADVPTLAAGKNNPKPIWISISGDTIIANNDTLDVGECLLQASATGDFASGVAEIRLSQISCSATDDAGQKWKIFSKIKGWVYSENGKYGVSGRIVGKEGEIIKKAIPLSVLQGAIKALGNVGGGGGATLPTATGGASASSDFQSGAGAGAGKALNKLSDYYLKILSSLNPIIEVKAGREVTIAFSGGEQVKLTKYTPVNANYFEDRENSGDLR